MHSKPDGGSAAAFCKRRTVSTPACEAQVLADLAEPFQCETGPRLQSFFRIVPARHRLAIRLSRLGVVAKAGLGLADIVLGRLLVQLGAGRQFQPRQRLARLAGTQQVDAQQKIGEIILRLQRARALQHRDGLGESRLPVQIESLLEQRLKFVLFWVRRNFACLLRAGRDAHQTRHYHADVDSFSDGTMVRHASPNIARSRVPWQTRIYPSVGGTLSALLLAPHRHDRINVSSGYLGAWLFSI